MADEGSRLLHQAENGYGTSGSLDNSQDRSTATDIDLANESRRLVTWARHNGQSLENWESIRSLQDEKHYLIVLLYALYLNKADLALSPTKQPGRARERVTRSRSIHKAHCVLLRLVTELLDRESRSAHSIEGDESDREQLGVFAMRKEEGEHVEDGLWRKWLIGDKKLSVVDLLLPPYTSSPSPFLSDPLMFHAMDHTWVQGPPSHRLVSPDETKTDRLLSALEGYITPRRAHLLNLLSYLFLLLLTVSLAIHPHKWIHPFKKQSRKPGAIEALYITWVYSTFFNAFPSIKRTLFLIPSILVPLLAYLDSETAFSSLALSILPLTFLLILPLSPSLVFLHPDIVPLSTLLTHILRRGIRSAGLILPLALLVFGVFAWSLNGDIFRGLDIIQVMIPSVGEFYGSTRSSASLPRQQSLEPPTEPGVAPFETRVWLFITFTALLLSSVSLTLVRILTPPHAHRDAQTNDPWEADYGPTISLAAREKWTMAIRAEIDRQEMVPPLNWIVEGFIPIDEVLFVLKYVPEGRKGPRLKRWEERLLRWRHIVWVCVMGPLCLPFHLWDKLLSIHQQH